MQAENLAREAEIAELRDLLAKARAELAGKMDEDKDQMINRLEKENKELKDKLADEKNNLQVKRDMIYFILYLLMKQMIFREILTETTTKQTKESMN